MVLVFPVAFEPAVPDAVPVVPGPEPVSREPAPGLPGPVSLLPSPTVEPVGLPSRFEGEPGPGDSPLVAPLLGVIGRSFSRVQPAVSTTTASVATPELSLRMISPYRLHCLQRPCHLPCARFGAAR